jgi:addiction module HigA family antidote
MMTVAETLKAELVTKRNKTVTEVASELEMSRPCFSNVVNGNAGLSVELALRIERTFGLDARKMLIRQLDEQIAAVRT